jgi:hypothetical protein
MYELFQARKKYGRVYVTLFPDGTLVPWKPLSIQDYLEYIADFQRGFIPNVIIEDEIFRKTVQEPSLIRTMDYLKAGTVSTVVEQIMSFSGPQTIEAFNEDIDLARQMVVSGNSQVVQELTHLTTLAFPTTPEQVQSQPYEKFILQFARAEHKLLQIGHLKEPVAIQGSDETSSKKQPIESRKPQPIQPPTSPNKPKIDAKSLWEKQQKSTQPNKLSKDKRPVRSSRSPVLEAGPKHNIDFTTESAEQSLFGLTGHEKVDDHIARSKMLEDTVWIYKDLIQELNNKRRNK